MDHSFRLDNIEKNYGAVKALDGVTLTAEDGKVIALLGANGAGKTTLLRISAGLEKPDKGNMFFNDECTTDTGLRQIATLVFQKTAMFSTSVYENLAYWLKIRGKKDSEIKNSLFEALQDVGLRNLEQRRAKRTSGGEQQRIALARAFLLEPKILLLDEPTANLDPYSASIIETAIVKRKGKGRIIIISTHNLSQARRLGDEIVHMHGGKIVEKASATDFFEKPKNDLTRKFLKGELDF
jgi:tungstate transport system ATP-binding protein